MNMGIAANDRTKESAPQSEFQAVALDAGLGTGGVSDTHTAHVIRTVVFCISLALHLSAIVYVSTQTNVYRTLGDWRQQYVVASGVLLALAVIQKLSPAPRMRATVLILRAILISVLIVPSSREEPFFGIIGTVLVLECFLDFGNTAGFALAAWFLSLETVLLFRPPLLWQVETRGIDPGYSVVIIAELFICSAIGYLLCHNNNSIQKQVALLKELRETNIRLARVNVRFQNVASEIEETTTERERTRIAREIHDSLGFTLTNVLALLNAQREKMGDDGEPIPEKISEARDLIRDGLVDLRLVLKTLRSETRSQAGDWNAFIKLSSVFQRASEIHVNLSFVSVPSHPDSAVLDVFYHAMQEGLTNAFRHGKANTIDVTFTTLGDQMVMMMRDDGVGATDMQGGFGLLGMKERVRELGGEVDAVTRPMAGFALRISIPLIPAVEETNEAQ